MKIGIDYHLVLRNPNSGMGVYVSEIVRSMRILDKDNKYIVFDGSFLYKDKPKNIFEKILGVLREQSWMQVTIPQETCRYNIDLFYFPNPPVPLFFSKPIILTIPDLSFLHDKSVGILIKWYLFVVYFLSAHKANIITTFSINSKIDIVCNLGIKGDKVRIVTPAVSKDFTNVIDTKNVLRRYNIVNQYLLSISGTFIPRKNPADLIFVFKTLPKHLQDSLQIVLIGNNKDRYFESFWRLVEKEGLADKVVCPGYVSEKELVTLYSGAKIFISTSLYEGFGLPPLQAMACGIPVVAYKNSSISEVVGEAGLLVNDRKELQRAILKIMSDVRLRRRLIKLGYLRAKNFSWKMSGKKMFNSIEEIRQHK